MPYLRIATTAALTPEEQALLRAAALDAMALLGKPRRAVLVHLDCGQTLTLGDAAGNCAFCDVRVAGSVEAGACDRFAQQLSEAVARIARTAPGGVYLSIAPLTQCYTDGCARPAHPPAP
ncbi:MAG: phenylpyruvate tautomerase MIF-related protein [Candidatus Limiplasma sp.]|nr:phenylpyruvate tautomerase MIF-related protein [Candidatus Limiplasma sp.]